MFIRLVQLLLDERRTRVRHLLRLLDELLTVGRKEHLTSVGQEDSLSPNDEGEKLTSAPTVLMTVGNGGDVGSTMKWKVEWSAEMIKCVDASPVLMVDDDDDDASHRFHAHYFLRHFCGII